jgi:hypothetical protein
VLWNGCGKRVLGLVVSAIFSDPEKKTPKKNKIFFFGYLIQDFLKW